MPSLSSTNYNLGLLNQQNKNRDLVGEMLAGTNPNAGIKNYSGNQLMPLVKPNVTGMPTALPMINQSLVPTGVTLPNVKDPNSKGKLGMGVKLEDTITGSQSPTPTNPKVADYLKTKYSNRISSKSESPAPQDKPNLPIQQDIESESPDKPENSILSKILAIAGGGLSSYGQGLLGQGTAGAGQQMMNTINTIRDRDKEADLKNHKSAESIHARNLAKQLYGEQYKVDPNLTALQFRESSPMLDNLYARTFKQQESDKDRAFREKEFNARNAKDWAQINMQKEAMGMRAAGGGSRGGGTSSGTSGAKSSGQSAQGGGKEFERKAQGFYNEMENANRVVTDLEKEGKYSTADYGVAPIERWKSDDRKKYESAQRNWAMADLRFKSGAAISDKEIDTHMKTYFPQPGDTPNVIAMKQNMRKQVNNNMALSAGMGDRSEDNYDIPQQQTQSNILTSAPQGMVEVLDPNGNTRAIPQDALSSLPKGWRRK